MRNKRLVLVKLNIQLPLRVLKLHNVPSLIPCYYFIHDYLVVRQTRLFREIVHRRLVSYHLLSVHFSLDNDCGEYASLQQHKGFVYATLHHRLLYYVLEFFFFWQVYSGAKSILFTFLLLLFVYLVLLR